MLFRSIPADISEIAYGNSDPMSTDIPRYISEIAYGEYLESAQSESQKNGNKINIKANQSPPSGTRSTIPYMETPNAATQLSVMGFLGTMPTEVFPESYSTELLNMFQQRIMTMYGNPHGDGLTPRVRDNDDGELKLSSAMSETSTTSLNSTPALVDNMGSNLIDEYDPTLTATGNYSLTQQQGPSFDALDSNIQKLTTTNGMSSPTYDLPSSWHTDPHKSVITKSSGAEVQVIITSITQNFDLIGIRSNRPIPQNCGIFYYEIEINSDSKDNDAVIGLAGLDSNISKMPGIENNTWGFRSTNGSVIYQGITKQYGPKFTKGDTIGCGVNNYNNTVFFTKNGIPLGTAFCDLNISLYPALGIRGGYSVRTNFGQYEFLFDIMAYTRAQKNFFYKIITPPNTNDGNNGIENKKLPELLQQLVSSYFTHLGYIDTARAFQEELQQEKKIFAPTTVNNYHIDNDDDVIMEGTYNDNKNDDDELFRLEDINIINRQTIRRFIMNGDIDSSVLFINEKYPNLLIQNEDISFKLKCQKFIEMIIKGNKLQENNNKNDNNEGLKIEDIYLNESLPYGELLRHEYKKNSKYSQILSDIFSLMAYPNPQNSPMSYLLDNQERIDLSEEVNSAILVSLGKSSIAPLEKLTLHTTQVINHLFERKNKECLLINVKKDFLK